MAWLTDYTYRKSITLSRASGAVTNYQMKLLVGESSGATGEDVDCGGHCASDFDDIRFTTSDGETLLDYWIESISGTTPNQLATIWIEFDSVGTGATTFYMYYGNAGASAASSGANTFPFFDHFEGASIDAAKWGSGGSPTIAVSGSVLTVSSSSAADRYVYGKVDYGVNYAFRSRMKSLHNNTSYDENYGLRRDSPSVAFEWAQLSHSTNLEKYRNRDTAGNSTYLAMTAWSADTYAILEAFRGAASVIWTVNDAAAQEVSGNYDSGDMHPYMYVYQTNASMSIDWCLIRQRLATEPAWGSWGSEEEESTEFTELEDAALYLAAGSRAPVRVTSAPLEIISDDPVSHNIRVTSAPLEIISDDPCSHNIRVTSAVIEIISTEYVVSVADDARLELSAYYQELEDALLHLQAAATAPLEDSKLWLRAHDGTEFNDAKMYLYTQGYEYDDALMYLTVGSYEYDDAALYLSVTDAITYDNAALYLYVTDGIARSDCRMYLTAVSDVPAAASSVYQRLTSIISEV